MMSNYMTQINQRIIPVWLSADEQVRFASSNLLGICLCEEMASKVRNMGMDGKNSSDDHSASLSGGPVPTRCSQQQESKQLLLKKSWNCRRSEKKVKLFCRLIPHCMPCCLSNYRLKNLNLF